MKISDLPLPADIIEYYARAEAGITELYPPQAEAVEKGLLDGTNILAAIPTASGKTLLSELAMLSAIRSGGKALYIVPLRALASEKYDHFSKFREIGVKVGISSGDLDSRDEYLGDNDIIVATSEKADSLLRNETHWIHDLTTLVVDEIHLLDSPDRGPTLEVTIAKLRKRIPRLHIIALSATVGNANEIADWLDAGCVRSEWRPVDLKEGVYLDETIHFLGRKGADFPVSRAGPVIALVNDTLRDGGQCLIFDSSRRNAVSTALRVSTALEPPDTADPAPDKDPTDLIDLASTVRESETDAAQKLADCIEHGVAFHHAGLISEHRRIVEDGFRNNRIKVIACTPTLAFGLNLPARRVIIKSYRRYDPNYGMQPIPILEYKQMAGRAGRPHLDPSGECVLIAKSYPEMQSLLENYIESDPEPIHSKLGTESALRSHILSAITGMFATTHKELMDFLELTFFAAQQETSYLRDIVENVLDFLSENEMIAAEGELLDPTPLGRLVSRLYLDPQGASTIIDGLRSRDDASDLTLLHLVCRTPDIRKLYLRKNDYGWIRNLVSGIPEEFTYAPDVFDTGYEWFLSEVKTAAVLLDWTSEVQDKAIETKFGIGGGDIRGIADTAQWIMYATARLSGHIGTPHTKRASDLTECLKYGVKPELLSLVAIRGVGRVRARRLYDAGYATPESLLAAGDTRVGKIVGPKVARNVIREIEMGGVEYA
ncbi:MAG: extensin [Candidatus Methanogaster sp.]|uniref:Extensin n=1 Tax=Candidatus Methanogaster sp. TaxID=3386292 RepID=A0AC61L293_9EURY|nr:MAG: extensin [ANME-2 cluster archaeon]